MPLAYYSHAPDADFWAEHWGGHSVEELVAVAKASPLTDLVLGALPARGLVLEAGCGLGQYVVLLRERGVRVAGVDWSLDALRRCRKAAPTAPLAVMDLRQLGVRSCGFTGYISLGVVEHDAQGPGEVLREARRVLEPGGVLIVSVPFINGARRLGARWILRRNRRLQAAGGRFYQFAFSRREARAFLEEHGFRVLWARPYDPARLLRSWARRLTGREVPRSSASPGVLATGGTAWRIVRRLLYTRWALDLFGHMILLAAVKVE